MSTPALPAVLDALPGTARPLVDALLAAAREGGWSLHLVGGPVRDLLLGVPLRDVDVVVEPSEAGGAAELAERAAPEGARVVSHGRFGTVRITHDGAELDLATARSESYEHPGALPTVAPGTLEEDLARRDFTVNALAIPLSPLARRARGGLYDPMGGLDDLHRKLLRVHHSASFRDDPTRALRAARLAPRLGFGLPAETRAALRDALREGAFGRVSGDRLRRELEKLFADAPLGLDPADALRRLAEWHVLPALEPGLELPRAARTPLRRLGRAVAQPPWPLGRARPWVAGLALWLAPLPAGLRARSVSRLGVRGDAAERITDFPRLRDRALRRLASARGRGAIDAALGPLGEEELLALHASVPARTARRIARFATEDRRRRLPVDGDDLVAAGLSGPAVGRALARIRLAFLDGELRTREEALALAAELARRQRPRSRERRGRRRG